MIIACDVDDVVVDLLPAWLARYNKDYDDHLKPEDITGWSVSDFVRPMCGVKIYEYLTADLYDDVQWVEGAYSGIQRLKELGHRVVFVTSTPNGSEGAKLHWLALHGFIEANKDTGGRLFDDYIECHDKSLVHADLMIDDRPRNLDVFKGPHTILFARPHNQNDRSRYYVCDSWPQVVKQVELMEAEDKSTNQVFVPGAFSRGFQERGYGYGPSFYVPVKDGPKPLHVTEQRSPNQAKRFKEILDEMYQVHLDKNADYSPANIMGVGELGLATRIWDKTTRLLNLLGFDIRAELIQYTGPKIAKNESVEDTLKDLSVYAIIGRLLREGKWGN